ncbi:MAG: tRNA lysidine(34) synthetase TilS [Azoarcus sp.]|nr:tRNA lysidine(34) synthetase TilS [Azoarcus sp.]
MSAALLDTVAEVLVASGVGPHSRLCCALSGGVDSVVLLDVLVRLRERFGYALSAAHVHHGLSPAADTWLGFCAGYCRRLDVPLSSFRVAVPRDDPQGLEAAARQVRHAALQCVECDWLVFGHHRDDQAETLLFRLFRGTGLRGAGAMPAVEPPAAGVRGKLRPLLEQGRTALVQWAQVHAIDWVEDESNGDCRFTRNDIRHRILPAIEVAFPAASTALARAASHFREASDLLDELAAADELACGGASLERVALLTLSDARIINLLRWQARQRGVPAPSSARLREGLRQLRAAPAARPLHLPLGELACCAYRGRVWLEPVLTQSLVACTWRGGVVPGQALHWGGGSVVFRAVPGAGIAPSVLGRAIQCRLVPRAPGLRLRLGQGRPSRTVKNLCQEAGIPVWMRERLPVLEIDGATVWIAGIGVDAAFACRADELGILPEWLPFSF